MRHKHYCSVAGCELPVKGHGFCSKHYQRFKDGNDPHTTKDRHRRTCEVDGCGELVHARGYCNKHWQRYHKFNHNPHNPIPKDLTDDERFTMRFTEKEGCWEWEGAKNAKGYGVFTVQNPKKTHHAHRVSYEKHIGPIPEGMHVLHKCDNPSCVNPNHLFVGTDKDNSDDKIGKGRQKMPLCRRDVVSIRQLSPTMTHTALSEIFGISAHSISLIVNRKTWKHI